MTIQNIPSKGRISVIKIQNFTIQKRQSLIRVVYGGLLVVISIVMMAIDPIEVATNWFLEMREGSFMFNMWANPTYDVKCEVWVFNYTNVNEYLAGTDKVLKLNEIGPFMFQEHRTNENMSVDSEQGILTFRPKNNLTFLPELSVGHSRDIQITVPSIAIIAISTLLADKFGYFANAGAYYSMKALDPRLFRNMTVEEYFWGYYDPIVTVANKFLPGWIDFKEIGVMDRFYAQRDEVVEIELKDLSKMYSIKTWAGSPGLKEQGFTDLNTSIPCNRVAGTYEGLMISPNVRKDVKIPLFRKQGCRVYPFVFENEMESEDGINFYRFLMEDSAFNNTSEFACKCSRNCLPNGFIDISNCYYGFPITLSKPHYADVDPVQMENFEGLHPDKNKYFSKMDLEPNLGAPLSLSSAIQVNIAVRTSPANPATKPLKDKILPLLWLKMFVEKPPSNVVLLLRLRFVIAPPLVITLEVVMFITGVILCGQGLYRVWKPKYQLVANSSDATRRPSKILKPRETPKRKTGNVIINMSFNKGFKNDDDELAKQAVSLLSIKEDLDLADFIGRDS